MDSAFVALIALAGTLLGSALTFALQSRQTKGQAQAAISERLRQERMAAYGSFLEAAAAFRAKQVRRWTSRNRYGAESEAYAAARAESYDSRVVARSAMYRLMLVSGDPALNRFAEEVMAVTIAIQDAEQGDVLKLRADDARNSAIRFAETASQQLTRVAAA